ncbi:MAG TPA: KH domain-containing protein [Desulfurivibrionaceae bacterium]|nr:KH domain-containing protein [Desulfurivibrionaceae bacterium]
MKELIAAVATQLVDNPGAVSVNETEQDDTTVLELRVAKEDLGKVIGKQGRTARAMRALLTAAAGKQNKKARLEILE